MRGAAICLWVAVVGAVAVEMPSRSATQIPTADYTVHVNDGDLDLSRHPSGKTFDGQMAGHAEPATASKWPASFVADGYERCSATVIGPHTLLTAAHCVGDGKRVKIRQDGRAPLEGICMRMEKYPKRDTSADYALCFIAAAIPVNRFETVSIDKARIADKPRLLATGYGCSVPDGPPADILQLGTIWIGLLPGFDSGQPNILASEEHAQSAFLCGGDSGGGAYYLRTTDQQPLEDRPRALVAINVSISTSGLISYLAPLSTPDAARFLDAWRLKDPDHAICGITPGVQKCKSTPP